MLVRIIYFFSLVLILSSQAFAQDAEIPAEADTNGKTTESVLTIEDDDIVFGDKNAPVTIVEYASLSCSHCAAFHDDTFPKLKENYIDTGKVIFVFRNFPLDEPALRASMLAHCSGEKVDKFLTTLFTTQANWAPKKNYIEILSNIAKLGGMTGHEFNTCIQDATLEQKVIAKKFDAVKVLKVRSTPTIYIAGKKYEGSRGYDYFSKIIDSELETKSQPQ